MVLAKIGCWLWCQSIPNSSIQALGQDTMLDVVFNTFSMILLLGELSIIVRMNCALMTNRMQSPPWPNSHFSAPWATNLSPYTSCSREPQASTFIV